jgi:hypothetical protein
MLNPNTSSLIALMLSVFFAGAYLRGEISRKAELKAELRAMKEQQERTMATVDSINVNYSKRKLEFLQMNQKLYNQLDTILELKTKNSVKLQKAFEEVRDARVRLDDDVRELNDIIQSQGIKN